MVASAEPATPQPADVAWSRAWLKLLHYRKNVFGSYRSDVDGQSFFIAPDGADDPEAELQATLEAISTGKRVGRFLEPVHCAFPERARFVSRTFHLPDPDAPCPRFDPWFATFKPQSATFVFASSYPDAPPSMFGHTFLRIDSAKDAAQHALLDYGVNFAATIPEDAGIEMGLYGLTGGYEGHFSVLPYHLMVAEYTHFEDRDLWEYDLDLTPHDIRSLLRHLWEIENNGHLNYYFLGKNCAFQILAALEAVRPEWELTEDFGLYALPVESLKRLTQRTNAMGSAHYRPAASKLTAAWMQKIPAAARQQVFAVAEGRAALNSLQDVATLDGLLAYLTMKPKGPGQELSDGEKHILHAALSLRAGMEARPSPIRVTPPRPPHEAHNPRMLAIAGGSGSGGGFLEMTAKPAMHDYLSDPTGYAAGMQLDALELKVRQDAAGHWNWHSLELLDMGLLAPLQEKRRKPSWHIRSALEPRLADEARVLRLDGGMGLATGGDGLVLYGMASARLERRESRASLYAGPALVGGAQVDAGSFFRALLEYQAQLYLFPEREWLRQLSFHANRSVSADWDLRLAVTAWSSAKRSAEASLGTSYRF